MSCRQEGMCTSWPNTRVVEQQESVQRYEGRRMGARELELASCSVRPRMDDGDYHGGLGCPTFGVPVSYKTFHVSSAPDMLPAKSSGELCVYIQRSRSRNAVVWRCFQR